MIPSKDDIEEKANEYIMEDYDEDDQYRSPTDELQAYTEGAEWMQKQMQEEIDRVKMAMATVLGLDKYLN